MQEDQYFCYGIECNIFKPASEFHKNSKRHCKKCRYKQVKESRIRSIEKRIRENLPQDCSKCGKNKPRVEFPTHTLTNYCNACHSQRSSESAKKTREKAKRLEEENKKLKEQINELLLAKEFEKISL